MRAKVENGRYNSASEVVREALRSSGRDMNKMRSAQLAEFNEELAAEANT